MRGNNPWMSFRQYGESDSARFKGRDEDISNVFQLVTNSDVSVVYAESGIGKSSLINAGLIPCLRSNMYVPLSFVLTKERIEGDAKTWFNDNIRKQLQEDINKLNEGLPEDSRYYWEAVLPEQDDALNDSLWWFLHTHRLCCMGVEVTLVLIFDQFEEMLRLKDDAHIEGFFEICQELVGKNIPRSILDQIQDLPEYEHIDCRPSCHILFSLREEFIGQLDYWGVQKFYIPSLKHNRYYLRPLTAEQAKEVIKGQGVDTLNDVAGNIIELSKDKDKGTISTLILSVLCSKLYDSARTGMNGEILPLTLLDMPVSAAPLIGEYYDEQMDDLRALDGNRVRLPKRHRRVIEGELVSPEGNKLRVPVDAAPLKRIWFKERYFDPLESANLVKKTEVSGVTYVELVHDKVAEMIFARMQQYQAKKTRTLYYIFLLIGVALLIAFSGYFMSKTTSSKELESRPYLEYIGKDIFQLSGGEINGKFDLRDLVLVNPESVNIQNCNNLETITLDYPDSLKYYNRLKLIITDCPRLRRINIREGLYSIEKISVTGSPRLEPIKLPSTVGVVSSDCFSTYLNITSSSKEYLSFGDGVWKKSTNLLIHINNPQKRHIPFPESADLDSVTFNKKLYYNARRRPYGIANDTVKIYWAKDSILILDDIPVERIGELELFDKAGVKTLYLSDKLSNLNVSQLDSLPSLSTVIFPDSSHFSFCCGDRLFDTELINGVGTEMGPFGSCNKLDSLIFGHYITSLSQKAFIYSKSITYVHLPDDVDEVQFDTGVLPHFYSNIGENSDFRKVDGIVFYRNTPFSSETNYHTYCDSAYYSRNGLLWKNDNNGKPLLIDCPDVRLLKNIGEIPIIGGGDVQRIMLPQSHNENGEVIYYQYFGIKHCSESILDTGECLHFEIPVNDVSSGTPKKIRTVAENSASISTLNLSPLCLNSMSDLKEIKVIHTLLRRPDAISNEGIYYPLLSFMALLPNELKENIVLYVPKGCRGYFIDHPLYQDFKEIREDSALHGYYYIGRTLLLEGLSQIRRHRVIYYSLIILLLITLMLYSIHSVKTGKRKIGAILLSLLGIVLGAIVWFMIYWVLYLRGLSVVLSNLIAVPIAIVVFVLIANKTK